MASAIHAWFEMQRPHNSWEKFTQRDVNKHRPEDMHLFHPQLRASEVVDQFINHGETMLDGPIPRRFQTLRRFLDGAQLVTPPGADPEVIDVINRYSSLRNNTEFAILDDR